MNESAAPGEDFSSSFEAAFARLRDDLEKACSTQPDWPCGVAAAIQAGFAFAAADPDAAEALTIKAMARGQDGVASYERLLAYLGAGLAPGRRQRPEGDRLPEVTEKVMAGGVISLVAQRLHSGRAAELPELAPEAIQFTLMPFLGRAAAMRVALERG
jgi:hypothetical protein